jgi:cell division protein ZapA
LESSAKRQVRVTILGQNLTLLASGDPAEVESLARRVDELLESIARRAPSADTLRVALLACLHLADQLHTLERDLTSLKSRIDKKSGEFAVLLEQALDSVERPG